MPRDSWAPGFLADALLAHSSVVDAEVVGAGVVRVQRVGMSTVKLAAVAVDVLDVEDVHEILAESGLVDAIVNVGKERRYSGEARAEASEEGVGLFTVAELFGALGVPDLGERRSSALDFAIRSLGRHWQVDAIEDLGGNVLGILRADLGDLEVVVAEIYTVSVADVERLLQRHRAIDAILNVHPYGSYGAAAKDRAADAGVGLFDMKEMYGALHRRAGTDFVGL